MAISFLDLVPIRPKATVVIESEAGPAEYEIGGVPLAALAEIGRRFPAFARVAEGNASLLTATDAMPALIAAGLGHHADAQYERQAAALPTDIIIGLASEVVRMTFLQRPTLLAGGSEPAPAMPEGANGALPELTSLAQLNN